MFKLVFGKLAIGALVMTLLVGGAVATAGAKALGPGKGTAPAAGAPGKGTAPAAGAQQARPAERAQALKDEFALIAKTIGISTSDLQTALKGGQTVAQVAQAHKVDPQTVIDAVVNDLTAKAQSRPGWAKLTDAQKATFTTQVKVRVTKFVNEGTKPAAKARAQHPVAAHVAEASFQSAAKTIGVTPQDLRTALKGGQTVAQVAQAHNVSPQTVIDNAVNDVMAKAQRRPGWAKLTDAQKTTFTTQARERITNWVNGTAKTK